MSAGNVVCPQAELISAYCFYMNKRELITRDDLMNDAQFKQMHCKESCLVKRNVREKRQRSQHKVKCPSSRDHQYYN